MKRLILILVFLCLAASLFAYPVSEDTYLSIKNYSDNLSDTVNLFATKSDTIADGNERSVFIILTDCIVICREVLNALTYFLIADNPNVEHIKIYCNERYKLINGYIQMLQSSTVLDKRSLDITMKILMNTKRALERVLSEITSYSSDPISH